MLIFNPSYKLQNDKDRILLMASPDGEYDNVCNYFIHPDIAYFLAQFDGRSGVQARLSKLGISKSQIGRLTDLFTNNNKMAIRYEKEIIHLPANLLVPNIYNNTRNDLNIYFSCEQPYNFKRLRLSYPKSLVLIINLSCYTNCIYCYANRKHKYAPLPTGRILELIEEAREIGVVSLTISGGEFFLHRDWKIILMTMLKNNFKPELSTKVPIDEDSLRAARKLGLDAIQFSLDTLDPITASRTLNVGDDYIDRIIHSIRCADKLSMKIILKPTLCKETCNVPNISSIIDFAATLSHIERVTVSTMNTSLYLSQETNHTLRPSVKQVEEVMKYLTGINTYFNINPDSNLTRTDELRNQSIFNERARCTANLDGFVILPDGKVTICEELYWHDAFLLGDLSQQGIMDVWTSEKALNLWNLDNGDMPEYTSCRTCEEIHQCRQNRGVCWKMIMQAYGMEKVFLPDPRCPKAPAPYFDIIDR